jgi:hypothetical protein
MSELDPQVLKSIDRLRRSASDVTRHLIDCVVSTILPIPVRNGFAVSPEYLRKTKNEFGVIWGINEIPFQDRNTATWPTILVEFDRGLSPNFRVDLCTIPQRPLMLGGHALPRHEANCAHSVRLLRLRKGTSGSYWDQHFGARTLACFKKKTIDQAVATAAELLDRVVNVKDRESFLEGVVGTLRPRHIYESWNKDTPHRPNQSS